MNSNFISPALIQAQRALLTPGIEEYVSAEVGAVASEAQAILNGGGSEWQAMKVITSKLKFAQTTIYGRNSFTTVSAGPNELYLQSQVKESGVSNIANRKSEVDCLVYGIELRFILAATATAKSNTIYNNLTASAAAGLQAGQFELWYGDGLVFDELVRSFIYDGTVKTEIESENYYKMVAPVMIKKGVEINPVVRLGTAVVAGGSDSIFTHVGLKAISIKVRVIK